MPAFQSTAERVRFDVFELDLRAGELHKGGRKIKLQEQPLRVLLQLMEKAGGVVTRDELRRELWPADTFVDFDHGLNSAVARLREALGDSAEKPRFIETVAKRGYRFIAPLESKAENPAELASLLPRNSRVPPRPFWIAADSGISKRRCRAIFSSERDIHCVYARCGSPLYSYETVQCQRFRIPYPASVRAGKV